MGIKGLYRFISENPDLLKPYKLHDSYVVIDGDNLVYPLYFGNKINVICGGDYNVYAECVRKYFCTFLECSIKPIIVFDGGFDKSGRKLKTIFQRINDRLLSVKKIAQNEKFSKQVLPILAHDVFICILNELNIPFAVCDYEADDHVVALANYYKCPVISADNDFFISDVQNGFIMRDSIEENVILHIDSNGKEYKYLNCSIYRIEDFLLLFSGIEKNVLPLLGPLMGNDYVEQDEFEKFFISIELGEEDRIRGILSWLKSKSLSDAINQILEHLRRKRKKFVRSVLENSVASDDLNLQHIINQKLKLSKCELLLKSGLTRPCGKSLPLDFIIKYHGGHYSSLFPNIVVLHKSFLVPQIDDINCSSSYMCARYIRRVMYGILTQHEVYGKICKNEKCLAPIEEYDRHEDKFEKELVEPIFVLEGFGMLPKISDLSCLKTEKAQLILTEALGINLDFVKNLPPEWQLVIGSVNYFLNNSVPCCTEEFLYALILNLIYCDIIKHRDPYGIALNYCKASNRNHICSSILCIMSKMSESEIQSAARKFKKYSSKPCINQDNPLCMKILHNYSQLQGCVSSVVKLNKLLGTCMRNPDIHRYLNGSFLYNLTKDISSWSDPKLSVAGILGRRTTLFAVFTLLESKVRCNVPNHYILRNASSSKVRVKSSKHFDNFIENRPR